MYRALSTIGANGEQPFIASVDATLPILFFHTFLAFLFTYPPSLEPP